jgi:opacity protein-like surface antigen
MIRRLALLAAFVAMALPALPQSASAQTKDNTALEVTLAWSGDRTNAPPGGCACFWMEGGKAEASANFGKRFSIVSEIAGEHANNINSAHQSLGLVTYLFGPRYAWKFHGRFVPFAQFLVGGVHGFDALFPNPDGSTVTPDAFAFAAGGGLNINVSRHLAIRVLQADYLQTQLPNDANNEQNHLRVSAGIVFRFPR